ncbi:MAG: glycosyltransferase, partial [Candidatus Hodarchaeota archaeon]
PREKFIVIPNSYDPERINLNKIHQSNRFRRDDRFTMTYVGNFMNLRSPEPLFKALSLMNAEEEDLNKKILLNLVGNLHEHKHLISEYGLQEIVNVSPPIIHNEVFTYLLSSDLLLLIDAPAHSMCLATKLVEYIFTGKPILAITSETGAAAGVVKATNTGTIVSPSDVAAIRNAIEKFREDFSKGMLIVKPNSHEVAKYQTRNCASEFVKTLNELPTRS